MSGVLPRLGAGATTVGSLQSPASSCCRVFLACVDHCITSLVKYLQTYLLPWRLQNLYFQKTNRYVPCSRSFMTCSEVWFPSHGQTRQMLAEHLGRQFVLDWQPLPGCNCCWTGWKSPLTELTEKGIKLHSTFPPLWRDLTWRFVYFSTGFLSFKCPNTQFKSGFLSFLRSGSHQTNHTFQPKHVLFVFCMRWHSSWQYSTCLVQFYACSEFKFQHLPISPRSSLVIRQAKCNLWKAPWFATWFRLKKSCILP